jgi:hypothetical protein
LRKIRFSARRIEISEMQGEVEIPFERWWTDGLPVVPPTEICVFRILAGTTRKPDDVMGMILPKKAPCSVEKIAINAFMAGCKPEYLPIGIATVEAACIDKFYLHGLLATTHFSGTVVIVDGPAAKSVGTNSGINAFGQGNRIDATIGRALLTRQ